MRKCDHLLPLFNEVFGVFFLVVLGFFSQKRMKEKGRKIKECFAVL